MTTVAQIIHVVPCSRWKKKWIVRCDGVPDVTIFGEEQALAHARLLAERMANRLAMPVVLRTWTVLERFGDESVSPARVPSRSF